MSWLIDLDWNKVKDLFTLFALLFVVVPMGILFIVFLIVELPLGLWLVFGTYFFIILSIKGIWPFSEKKS